MSGVAAMPTWRFVTDNEMGRPGRAAPTGEETAPMSTICSISELAVAVREPRHYCGKHVLKGRPRSRDARRDMRWGAAWTRAGQRHTCSTPDGRA
jgi:hypothetical protein